MPKKRKRVSSLELLRQSLANQTAIMTALRYVRDCPGDRARALEAAMARTFELLDRDESAQ